MAAQFEPVLHPFLLPTQHSYYNPYQKISAAEQVFSTFELAEAIIMELSIHDVLINISRVSRTCHATIHNSIPIQQALFMRPMAGGSISVVPQHREHQLDTWFDQYGIERQPLQHPLLTAAFWGDIPRDSARWHRVHRAEASWRGHLTHQPPASHLTLHRFAEWGDTEPSYHDPNPGVVHGGAEGVRMRDLGLSLDRLDSGAVQIGGGNDVMEALLYHKLSVIHEYLKETGRIEPIRWQAQAQRVYIGVAEQSMV